MIAAPDPFDALASALAERLIAALKPYLDAGRDQWCTRGNYAELYPGAKSWNAIGRWATRIGAKRYDLPSGLGYLTAELDALAAKTGEAPPVPPPPPPPEEDEYQRMVREYSERMDRRMARQAKK